MLTACGIETVIIRNTFLSNRNVATVLTACGIETLKDIEQARRNYSPLQQCLPLAVLKRFKCPFLLALPIIGVATVLTACGIETMKNLKAGLTPAQLQQCLPLAVLKLGAAVGGMTIDMAKLQQCLPLAVLKRKLLDKYEMKAFKLQQCLPLAVLKLFPLFVGNSTINIDTLQQCLPLAVLKPDKLAVMVTVTTPVATVLTACGIETPA